MIDLSEHKKAPSTASIETLLDELFIEERDQAVEKQEEDTEGVITESNSTIVRLANKIIEDVYLKKASAMRAFLRADPDVVMIGEMRDLETASTAIDASLTGHLVLSTLHTNNAPETVTRLLKLGIDQFNFADSLLGILAQRLVRKLCEKCKEPYHPLPKEFDRLKRDYGEGFEELGITYDNNFTLYRPKGCDACRKTGYKGRMGIFELLVSSERIKDLIYTKAKVEEIRKVAMTEGMKSLIQDGIEKAINGLTCVKEVISVCSK